MNPETTKIYMKYKNYAIYGGLAVFVAVLAKNLIEQFLKSINIY
jgi:hypothetical protein